MSFHPCHGFVRVGLTKPKPNSQSPDPGIEPIIGREGYESQHAAGAPAPPIWHHGANQNQEELLSGEIRCTLTNRTPLLVANEQVPVSELEPALRQALQAKIHFEKPDKKKVLYPSLAPSGALLLPGESIKGMLAQVLGALTDSPLQRVNERSFSYRPNAHIGGNTGDRVIQAAALITEEAGNSLRVWPVFDLRKLIFCKDNLDAALANAITKRTQISLGRENDGPLTWCEATKKIKQTVPDSWLRKTKQGRALNGDLGEYFILSYNFGLDKGGKLAKAFIGRNVLQHPAVMVRCDTVAGLDRTVDPTDNERYYYCKGQFPLEVPASILANYRDTQSHIVDSKNGHLNGHPNSTEGIEKHGAPRATQLVFCEVLRPEELARLAQDPAALAHEFKERQGTGFEVISLGHNFRYRWRHLDSTTQASIGFDSQSKTWKTVPRAEMRSGPIVRDLPPLTRLLGEFLEGSPAGRVSINDALERNSSDGKGRFLTGSWQDNNQLEGLIALHPLTSRKPHFFPHHLNDADQAIGTQNDPLKLQSWGDGLVRNVEPDGKTTWRLQGRAKNTQGRSFYFHPSADVDWDGKDRARFDLNSLMADPKGAPRRAELSKLLSSDQSALSRWVRKPGGEFGFCVRFKNLESSELALLKAALDPTQYLNDPGSAVEYLHKLGHGRPLGWGSVHLKIDETVLMDSNGKPLGADDPRCQTEATNTLIRTEAAAALKRLMLQRQKDNGTPAPYLLQRPEGEQQGTDLTKFANHVRKRHLEGSRRVP